MKTVMLTVLALFVVCFLMQPSAALEVTITSRNGTETTRRIDSPLFAEADEPEFRMKARLRLPKGGDWNNCKHETFDDDSVILITPLLSISCSVNSMVKQCRARNCAGVVFATMGREPGYKAMMWHVAGTPNESSHFLEISADDAYWIHDQLMLHNGGFAANATVFLESSFQPNPWKDAINSIAQKALSLTVVGSSVFNIVFATAKGVCVLGGREWSRPCFLTWAIILFELIANLLRAIFFVNLTWFQSLSVRWLLVSQFGSFASFWFAPFSINRIWGDARMSGLPSWKDGSTDEDACSFRTLLSLALALLIGMALNIVLGVVPAIRDWSTLLYVIYCILLLLSGVFFIWQYFVMSTERIELVSRSAVTAYIRQCVQHGLIAVFAGILFIIGMLAIILPWYSQHPSVFYVMASLVFILGNLLSAINIDSIVLPSSPSSSKKACDDAKASPSSNDTSYVRINMMMGAVVTRRHSGASSASRTSEASLLDSSPEIHIDIL